MKVKTTMPIRRLSLAAALIAGLGACAAFKVVPEVSDLMLPMRAALAVSSDCEDTCIYVRVSVDKGDGVWYLLRDDITTLCAEVVGR